MPDNIDINDDSIVSIPIRNLLVIILTVAVAVIGYFEVTNRISVLERHNMLMEQEMEQNTEFRIKWPRGELGSLPDDMMQNAQLTTIQQRLTEIDRLRSDMQDMRIDINKAHGTNETQSEKLETLFQIWNEQLLMKNKDN